MKLAQVWIEHANLKLDQTYTYLCNDDSFPHKTKLMSPQNPFSLTLSKTPIQSIMLNISTSVLLRRNTTPLLITFFTDNFIVIIQIHRRNQT
jgi:hypothetical protein